MSNTDRIAKNTVFLYLRSLVVLLISLYTSRVILRVLGVEDYGVFCVVGGVIGMLGLLSQTMRATYQRYYNVEMGRKNSAGVAKMFQLSLSSQLLLAVIVLLLGETVGLWFVANKLVIPEERLVASIWVYQASLISFIVRIFETPFSALITAYERMGFFAVVSIIDAILRLAIVFLIQVLPGDALIVYSYLLALVSFVDIIIYVVYCKRKIETTVIRFGWDKSGLKNMFAFSWWSIFGEIGYTLQTQGINIVLNLFFGPIVNAARGVAAQVLNAVNQFIRSFQTSFRPQLTKSYASGDYNYMRTLYYSATKLSYYLIFTLSLPIIMETPYILHLWLGDNVPEYTTIFTRLVLVTSFVSTFANPTSGIAYATGKIKRFSIGVGIGNVLILPVAWVFLKAGFSPVSTLIVCLIMTILIQLFRLLDTSKTAGIHINDYFKKVIVPTLFFSVITPVIPILIVYFINSSFYRLLITCVVSVIMCLICGWLVGLNQLEKSFVMSKIRNVKVLRFVFKNKTIE
ncbi:MAG: oligosaccharide flippase family protein [bacterium]|nr:oligosaccharide flippase family protein [Candidatus Limimorpha caballi]